MQSSADDSRTIIHRRSGRTAHVQQLGPYAIEALLERHEAGAGTVYRVSIAPQQHTSISFHQQAEEYYFVLAGRGTAILNGQDYPLAPGDFLRLPPGTTHGFRTEAETLELLDIHTPGCWPDHDTFFVDAVPAGFGPGEAPK